MKALKVQNISIQFGDFYAVKNISFSVDTGKFVTLLGPSGCGKTTTLKTIAGFYQPNTGSIEINGVDVTEIPPERRNTTMCFQSYALFPHLNVAENIQFGLRQKKIAPDLRQSILQDISKQLHLENQLFKTPAQLSGGQQQRVALARALAMRSGIILFDEPLSNLDAKLREQVRFEMQQLQKDHGFTAIYVTHDQSESLAMSDDILVFNEGKIEQQGSPQEIYSKPINSFVADFIGTANILPCRVLKSLSDRLYRISTAMGDMVVASDSPPESRFMNICWRPEAAILNYSDVEINIFNASVELAVYQGNLTDVLIGSVSNLTKEFSPKIQRENNKIGKEISTSGDEVLKNFQVNNRYRIQLFQSTTIKKGEIIKFHIQPDKIRFLETLNDENI